MPRKRARPVREGVVGKGAQHSHLAGDLLHRPLGSKEGCTEKELPAGNHLAVHPILYKVLRRYRGDPWRLGGIVAAPLVLLHHENHRTT